MNNNGSADMPLAGWFSEMEEDHDRSYSSHGKILNNTSSYNLANDFAQELVINTDQKLQQSCSSDSSISHPYMMHKRSHSIEISQTGIGRPFKQIKTETPVSENKKSVFTKNRSNGFEISFEGTKYLHVNTKLKPELMVASDETISFAPSTFKGFNYDRQLNASKSRPPSHDKEHAIAERRRREKLNQHFVDLAAIVPGLKKKMDKASVLGDAVKYLKRLQERMKLLDSQSNRKNEERVILVNKSKISDNNGDMSSCDENSDGHFEESSEQFEARISGKDVLIRIHCENQKGLTTKILTAIESVHLTVANSSFLPFGKYKMDITIVAQMEAEFSLAVKDFVRKLKELCAT